MAGQPAHTRRIVLLGKTGSGKSSLGNTLFGGKVTFEVDNSANSKTHCCRSEAKTINGRRLQLIDTPGLFDTDLSSDELTPELLRCIEECEPGPHAFLLVLKVERYTKQEKEVVDVMLKYFSEEALKYTTVVFTHGDQLEKGQKIEEWAEKNESLKKLVQKCGGPCHVIDNKYWNNTQDPYRNNQHQVEQLLQTIDRTVTENQGHYTNGMLEAFIQTVRESKGEYDINKELQTIQKIVTGIKGEYDIKKLVQAFFQIVRKKKGDYIIDKLLQAIQQIVTEKKECNYKTILQIYKQIVTVKTQENINKQPQMVDNEKEEKKEKPNQSSSNNSKKGSSDGAGNTSGSNIMKAVGIGVAVGVVLGIFLGGGWAWWVGASCLKCVAGGAAAGAVVGGAGGGIGAWMSQGNSEHPKSE